MKGRSAFWLAIAPLAAVAGCSGVGRGPMPATAGAGETTGGLYGESKAVCPIAWNPNAKPPPGLTDTVGGLGKTGLPVTIVNKSGFPDSSIFLYATGQNSTGGVDNGYYYYLGSDGGLKYFDGATTHAPGFQLTCFPGSIPGKRGAQYVIPASASAGRLWIAIAPQTKPSPGPDSNPLLLFGSSAAGAFIGPAPWNGTSTWRDVLFDVVEYALSPAKTPNYDLTQVDFIGLPLMVQPDPAGAPIGIDPANEAALLKAFADDKAFAGLVYYSTIDGQKKLTRIYNPAHAAPGIAPNLQDYFTEYLSNVVIPVYEENMDPKSAHYHSLWTEIEPLMTNVVLDRTPKAYYAGYDAKTESFLFTPCEPTGCKAGGAGLSGSVGFSKNAVTSPDIFQDNQGTLSASNPVYYLLKALTTDLNRGVAIVPGQHPAPGLHPGPGQSPYPYYSNPVHNDFSEIVHKYSINDTGYGFAWDDCCGQFAQSNDYNLPAGVKGITITIGPIPN